MQKVYLTIDIGGTKTLIALFSPTGELLKKQKFPTAQTIPAFQTDLAAHLAQLLTPGPYHIASAAIAVPGLTDGPIATSLPNLPDWRRPNLAQITRDALSAALHTLSPQNTHSSTPDTSPSTSDAAPGALPRPTSEIPIALNNDAAIATAFEAKNLPGRTIYLTFSTGIGGGLAQDGSVTPDSAHFEPGHDLYPWRGQPTQWEHFASARALERDYFPTPVNSPASPQKSPIPNNPPTPHPVHPLKSPTPVSTGAIPAKSLATDLTSPAQLADIARRLTPGLAHLIKKYHPAHIIIGGPLGDNFPLYQTNLLNNLRAALTSPDSILTPTSETPDSSPEISTLPSIIQAKHPQESTIYGCYLFAHHLSP